MYKPLLICCSALFLNENSNANLRLTFFFLLNFSQVDQECREVDARYKEQTNLIQQLTDEIDKIKSLTSKEIKLLDQQSQQNEKINDEIKSVLNLTAFEEAKLARGQIDE